jgi:hypothetical protein
MLLCSTNGLEAPYYYVCGGLTSLLTKLPVPFTRSNSGAIHLTIQTGLLLKILVHQILQNIDFPARGMQIKVCLVFKYSSRILPIMALSW